MSRIAVIGCGVVGAAIAYELSQVSQLEILVFDRQPPAQAATGAALGVLMGVISHKVKGRTWQLRQASIQRYATLIPELEAATGQTIPFNSDGIVSLCFEAAEIPRWESLIQTRQAQQWPLELWSVGQLRDRCPQLQVDSAVAAIYSPQDGQVDPTALTHALVKAAQHRGVQFDFAADVTGLEWRDRHCQAVQTATGSIPVDGVVIAAGLGSTPLTAEAPQGVTITPVLGQALQLQLQDSMGDPTFQPVVNGHDIHIVPLGQGQYWVGATVEFPSEADAQHALQIQPVAERLEAVRQGAIAFCPALAEAQIVKTWSGLRPRPQGRPAPVIEWLSEGDNVFLATAHYRNGVLLAPATAQWVRDALLQRIH